ncbi:MAG: hypothetical protein QNK23_14675 [Crocinitomicaceae bacterium]|nr:hypothetical protein [Crocinitomicaceae bacterium]
MVLAIIALSILAGLFSYSAYHFYKHSKHLNVAKWARKNKSYARLLLVIFNLSMVVIGASIGLLFSSLNLQLSEYTIYVGLGLFIFGTVFFPSSEKGGVQVIGRYRRKQFLSLCRIGGSSLAMIAFANQFIGDSSSSLVTTAGASPVLLIILASVGLVIFGAIILALSCGLACNGYEGAAMLLLFGGTIGLITAYVLLIRKINRNRKDQEKSSHGSATRADVLDDSF